MCRLGPEDSLLVFPNANSLMASWNDVTVTYKPDDKFIIAGEANFFYEGSAPHNLVHAGGSNSTAYDSAAYITYGIDVLTKIAANSSGAAKLVLQKRSKMVTLKTGNPKPGTSGRKKGIAKRHRVRDRAAIRRWRPICKTGASVGGRNRA
jgi:hypothetical protein